MMTSNTKILCICLCLASLLLFACGPSSSGKGEGGDYRVNLVFPEDIPRQAETSEIDCAAAGIATIVFNFIAEGKQYGPHPFPCKDHNSDVSGVPVGKNVTVEVFADDANGNALLEGSEQIDIPKGREVIGGKILMSYVSPVIPQPEPEPQPQPEPGPEPQPQPERFTNAFGMEFARIPAGTFMMGSPETELGRKDDETQHRVTLTRDFYMQTTEMTRAQWREVVLAAQAEGLAQDLNLDLLFDYPACGDNCPANYYDLDAVDGVDNVRQFITALNQLGRGTYALPTEAQWEYAARGGTTSALPNGALPVTDCGFDPNLDEIAWYCGNSVVNQDCAESEDNCLRPHPVGLKAPNAYGLYDMIGNAAEWCADLYGPYPATAQIDPSGPSAGGCRVLRGGSFSPLFHSWRSAARFNIECDVAYDFAGMFVRAALYSASGFRLVCLQPGG